MRKNEIVEGREVDNGTGPWKIPTFGGVSEGGAPGFGYMREAEQESVFSAAEDCDAVWIEKNPLDLLANEVYFL